MKYKFSSLKNTMPLDFLLTVVIPCKNEGYNIYNCLKKLSNQKSIDSVKVIVADNSDNGRTLCYIYKAQKECKNLNIIVIEGGYPSKARLEGSKLATTKYILFLDADVILNDDSLLLGIITDMSFSDVQLSTTLFTCEKKWNWIFRTNYFFQKISKLIGTPFAMGGFQLWLTDAYWKLGGYKEDELFAEDYSLSSKVKSKHFKIYKTKSVYTSGRRFDEKGVMYMFKMFLKSYLNRKNPSFFKKHHQYWEIKNNNNN